MSIFKRKRKTQKNGYAYEVQIYYKVKGVTKRYTKGGFKTKKEAQEHEAMTLEQIRNEGKPDIKRTITLNQVYEEFMELGAVDYQPTTIANTKKYYRKFKDELGKMDIREIDYQTLQEWFNARSDDGIGTNENAKKAISRIFRFAIKCGYITSNPCAYVTCVGIERHEDRGQTLSREDFIRLTSALNAYTNEGNARKTDEFTMKSYAIAVSIGYYTGARVSEVLALEKSDIDFDRGTISFNKKLQYRGLKKNEFYASERMKNKASKATIPLASELADILARWFTVNPYNIICCYGDGGYLNVIGMQTVLKKFAKEMGITFYFHMLRHTMATNLYNNGVDIKTAMEILRHANASTTLGVYSHISEAHKREALNGIFEKNHVKSTLSSESAPSKPS